MAGAINDAKGLREKDNCKMNSAGVVVPCGCWPLLAHPSIAGTTTAIRDMRRGGELFYQYGGGFWGCIFRRYPFLMAAQVSKRSKLATEVSKKFAGIVGI
jgi:hypothetical protein